MLFKLSADQTDFFGLSGADFLVLLLQLLLVCLAPLVLVVLEPFPSRTVSAQPSGSRGYFFMHSGFGHTNVLSLTFNFGFHFAQ